MENWEGISKMNNSEMNNSEIYSHVDHTLLKAYASWEEIKKLCDEAVTYRTASVCIPPSYKTGQGDVWKRF